MRERNRVISLILIMAAVALIGGGIAVFILYRTAMDEERERLVVTAQSQARLIEAVARFDAIYSTDYPGGPTEATLSQIIDAHERYHGFGETGEFTLARREGNQIVFVLSQRKYALGERKPIPFDSELAEPMRRALSGLSGTMVGLDYRGETVLAAYEPMAELDLGIVAKIDLAEVRAPFVRAALLGGGAALVLILLGALGSLRITSPILRRLRERSEQLEKRVEDRTRELQAAQEQLVRHEKLAVLGELAGGVGHELRNPLGAISNAVYFLNMALEKPEPDVKEMLEVLKKEVGTAERIINSLLEFARPRTPTRHTVNIDEVLQEALSRSAIPKNVEVVSQPAEALPSILADPDQLGQIFSNLILNAIQAMPEGGRLVIKSEVPSPEWVAISFTDTGVGIPEENLGKLFEPLFTTRARGIGLGMAVVKGLVEAHEGTIEVQSEVGEGTTFTVRLPLAKEKDE
jgi:signal transduction histidine kinase